jgi:hypothetical protein
MGPRRQLVFQCRLERSAYTYPTFRPDFGHCAPDFRSTAAHDAPLRSVRADTVRFGIDPYPGHAGEADEALGRPNAKTGIASIRTFKRDKEVRLRWVASS